MNDQHDLPVGPPPAQPAPSQARRTLGIPVVGAIAAAALVIGGLLGGIIGYAVHSDGPDFGDRQGVGPGQRFREGPDGRMPQPPDGQLPDPQGTPSESPSS